MKTFKYLLAALAVSSGAALLAESPFSPNEVIPSNDGLPALTTAQADALYKSHSAVFVGAKTDLVLKIPGSQLLNPSSSKEEIEKALPDKGATIVAYGGDRGCKSPGALGAVLKKLGYKNVVEYPAGVQGWINTAHPGEEN